MVFSHTIARDLSFDKFFETTLEYITFICFVYFLTVTFVDFRFMCVAMSL